MRLSVTTPRGAIVESDVDEVTAPGELGELGVLPGHVPLMTSLKPGVLTYREDSRSGTMAVGQGFLQVAPAMVAGKATDRILVLVDQAVAAASVDRAAAERALAGAEAEIAAWKRELDGAYRALVGRRDWALAQINAAARVQTS